MILNMSKHFLQNSSKHNNFQAIHIITIYFIGILIFIVHQYHSTVIFDHVMF
jgi:hypothetical protein